MKMKIIGILIGLILITTVFAVAQTNKTVTKETSTTTSPSTLYSVDVPVWEIGDKWTYKIDNITITTNQTDIFLSMDQLPLTVTVVDETSYTLEFETSVNGHSQINADLGDGPVNVTITLPNLQVSGTITIDKSTLGIKALSADLTGRFWIDIKNQPYIEFSLPVLPFKITTNLISDFSLPASMLSFPLNTTMIWNSTATNLTMNGEIRSPWFYFIKILNQITTAIGNPLLPPEIELLLPIVNIQEAFTTLGTGNVFGIPIIPGAFMCLNTETIIVNDVTYDTYNITILNGMAECFYAPTAGSIVKLSGNLEEIIPLVKNINMELVSTTYS
jgi:hypothetical protein